MACKAQHNVGGSGGMLPQENFEITPSKAASGGFSDTKFISQTHCMKDQLRMFRTMILEQRDQQLRTCKLASWKDDVQVGGVLHQPREDNYQYSAIRVIWQ